MYRRRGLGCIGFTAGVPCHIINSKVTHTCLNEALCCVCLEQVLHLGAGAGGELVWLFTAAQLTSSKLLRCSFEFGIKLEALGSPTQLL